MPSPHRLTSVSSSSVSALFSALSSALAIAALSSCGASAAGRLEPRFVAVQNAVSALGLAQSGPISEGSLGEGGEVRITQRLEAGECYLFVAIGTGDARALALKVLDPTGTEVGGGNGGSAELAVHVCARSSGDHAILVRMASGNGGYLLARWSGARRTSNAGPSLGEMRGGTGGSCNEPLAVTVGVPMPGDTSNRRGGSLEGQCAQGDAPEDVYVLEVRERANIHAVLQSSFDGALYLQAECGRPDTELACNDDAPDTSRSEIHATVDPGRYFIVVDGYNGSAGTYQLTVDTTVAAPPDAICGDAPALTSGTPVRGTTQGQPDAFQATCGGGARSSDRVYHIDVPTRSRLRVRQQTDHDGVLYLRSVCTAPASELACNDDAQDQNHSILSQIVDPGSYFVVTDGYGAGASGGFVLTAELAPETGGGAVADACSGPAVTPIGTTVDIDTFAAADDAQGSCGGAGAPDVVHRIEVPRRSRLRVQLDSPEFEGALYLQRSCGQANTEVACGRFPTIPVGPSGVPGALGNTPYALETAVDAGTYFLVVDGQNAAQFGAARMTVTLEDLAALEQTCRGATQLRPGRTVRGNTASSSNRFQASCAGNAQSNDDLYQLRLSRRSRVEIAVAAEYDAALYLRRSCVDPSTELACNDDATDNRHARIDTTLDAGTYYVFVDGFGGGANGPYTLDVTVRTP